MLTQVDVAGIQPSLATLALPIDNDISTSPIQIKDISGLEPVKADIASSPYGSIDGSVLTGSSVGMRNIVFKFGLNPDWAIQTMEELRQLLYKYFMPKLPVTLTFTSTHLPVCAISGVVEDLTPNMFSADPEIQVSIVCPNPDFVAVGATTVNGVVTTALTFVTIPYAGSKPAGINLKINSNVAHVTYTGVLLVAINYNTEQDFNLASITVDATHYFELNSVPGAKYVRKVLSSDHTNIVNLMNQVTGTNPPWPTLNPGNNGLAVKAASAGQDWALSYFAHFGGL